MGEERRRWLEGLARACEHLIAEATNHPNDRSFVAMQTDATALLDRIRSELAELAAPDAQSMQIFLETQRLLLRRFTADDVGNLVELDSDPEVMRFINGGRPTSREEIENDVLPTFFEYYERFPGYGFWAAVEKSTGRFVGWFHFRPPKGTPSDEVELGYRLRKSAWGNGYATEGSRALIEKGFAELGVRRVFAATMVVNGASRRVMEKAGLKFVRVFHAPWPDKIEGDEHGDVEYALLRSEWEQQRVDSPPPR